MQTMQRPFEKVLEMLRAAGLRPTRQRLALAKLLFDGEDRHVTAEQLFAFARKADAKVSLATVYNTLHQFKEAGLLREVVVEPGRSYFDTNMTEHHHFYDVDTGMLYDIPLDQVSAFNIPAPPAGTTVQRVDVVVRISSASGS